MGFRPKRVLRQSILSSLQRQFINKYKNAINRVRWYEIDKMIAERYNQIKLTPEQTSEIESMLNYINKITLPIKGTIKEFRFIGSHAKNLVHNSFRISIDLVAMLNHVPLKREMPKIIQDANSLLKRFFQDVTVKAFKKDKKGDLVIVNESNINYSFNIFLHCYNHYWLRAIRNKQLTTEHIDINRIICLELAMMQVVWCEQHLDSQSRTIALMIKDLKLRYDGANVRIAKTLNPWLIEWLCWCVQQQLRKIYNKLTNAMFLELFLDQLTNSHASFKRLCPALPSFKKDCLSVKKHLKLRRWANKVRSDLILKPKKAIFIGDPNKNNIHKFYQYKSNVKPKRKQRSINVPMNYRINNHLLISQDERESYMTGKPILLTRKTFRYFRKPKGISKKTKPNKF